MNGNSSNRFGSFFDRVRTERTALRIVNTNFAGTEQLHGITESAINSWSTMIKVSDVGQDRKIETIASILIRLSSRIDALADQSRTVFSNERFPILASDEILHELNLACQALGK